STAAMAPDPQSGRGPQRPGRPGRAPADAGTRDGDTAAGDIRTMTLEQFQAQTAIETWIDRLKRLREDDIRRRAYGLGDAASSDLVAELIHAARRTGLAPGTAAALEEVNFGLTVERQAGPAAIVGAERINGFVATLGMRDLPEAERPRVNTPEGATRPVFARPPASETAADLPAQPRPLAEEVWTDWVFALDALFVANAKDGAGGEIDIERNLALGEILAALNGRDGP
ncbi:MAG: hypothetical protein KDK02_14255, partial [Rhodobacteraceae bacterium]|nr:hypothetical protein [Paracoccaceae bacterium]